MDTGYRGVVDEVVFAFLAPDAAIVDRQRPLRTQVEAEAGAELIGEHRVGIVIELVTVIAEVLGFDIQATDTAAQIRVEEARGEQVPPQIGEQRTRDFLAIDHVGFAATQPEQARRKEGAIDIIRAIGDRQLRAQPVCE